MGEDWQDPDPDDEFDLEEYKIAAWYMAKRFLNKSKLVIYTVVQLGVRILMRIISSIMITTLTLYATYHLMATMGWTVQVHVHIEQFQYWIGGLLPFI